MSMQKRAREAKRRAKKKEKAERRVQRKALKAQRAEERVESDEDPDIAGIVPGPQLYAGIHRRRESGRGST